MGIEAVVQNAKFTVLLGKNGAGKSTLLRQLVVGRPQHIKYVSPERGGTLKYDPNVDNSMANNADWLRDTRQKNRFEQFREQSAAQFRSLEMAVLRGIEQDPVVRAGSSTFDDTIAKVNEMLPAIKLVRTEQGFAITGARGVKVDEGNISSGEAELISLAIEVLVFSRSSVAGKMLLLDEPDVHLHPDLQQRFAAFVEAVATERDIRVVIATHSTAVVGAFTKSADLQIVPVSHHEQSNFDAFKRSAVCEEVLPIFGAHPLSTAFNKSPVVLVEGDDDRRVLDQAVRSGNGKYSFSPCVVGTITDMAEWEGWLNKFLPVIYDEPKAYSLRDLDDSKQTAIDDAGLVTRMRLNCYAMENLLLSDQVLDLNGHTAASFKAVLEAWIAKSTGHKYAPAMQALVGKFDNRRTSSIKDVRNIIVAELGTNKPWEVLVGQVVAAHADKLDAGPDSLQTYLGKKVVDNLFAAG